MGSLARIVIVGVLYSGLACASGPPTPLDTGLADPIACIDRVKVLALLKKHGFRPPEISVGFGGNRDNSILYFNERFEDGSQGDLYVVSGRGISIIRTPRPMPQYFDDNGHVVASKIEGGRWLLNNGNIINEASMLVDNSGQFVVYARSGLRIFAIDRLDVPLAIVDIPAFSAREVALRDNRLMIFGVAKHGNALVTLNRDAQSWKLDSIRDLPPGRFVSVSPSGHSVWMSKEVWPLVWNDFILDLRTNATYSVPDTGGKCIRFFGDGSWLDELLHREIRD